MESMKDQQAVFLEQMANSYDEMLRNYCARCVSYNPQLMPLVQDIVQETYLKAAENVDTLMAHDNIPGWLKKSCHFSLLNALRKKRNKREISTAAIEKLQLSLRRNDQTPQAPPVTLTEVIAAAEALLSETDQAIFNDYFLDGESTQRTAELNSMTYDAVRGRISRIRKKLKQHFEAINKE